MTGGIILEAVNCLQEGEPVLEISIAATSDRLQTCHEMRCCSHKSALNPEVFLSNEEVKLLLTIHARHLKRNNVLCHVDLLVIYIADKETSGGSGVLPHL